jgi:hypothetical protein
MARFLFGLFRLTIQVSQPDSAQTRFAKRISKAEFDPIARKTD